MHYKPFLILMLLLPAAHFTVDAQYCTMVTDAKQKARLDSVISSWRIDTCCHAAIGPCLKLTPQCGIAARLANFACFLTVLGRDRASILADLDKRYACMHAAPMKGFSPDTSLLPPAGDPASPVAVAAYINASCPMCKRVSVPLYEAVTGGELKGKARLFVIPFSPQLGNTAFLAAHRTGVFWKFYLWTADMGGRPDEAMLVEIAERLGVSGATFKALLHDKSLESAVEKSCRKAKAIGVSSTPAVFIGGKLYTSHKDTEWIIDAIEYEFELAKKHF